MSIKINMDSITKIEENLSDFGNEQKVPLSELMSDDFISNCSAFSSLDELFSASGFKCETPEDFAAIPDAEWDKFITENTSYNSWEDMQREAWVNYFKNQLFKGF